MKSSGLPRVSRRKPAKEIGMETVCTHFRSAPPGSVVTQLKMADTLPLVYKNDIGPEKKELNFT